MSHKCCQCCSNFHIVYYKSGSKEVITARLPKESGYNIMRKRANAMAVGLMAQAVHPDDVKALIMNTKPEFQSSYPDFQLNPAS